MKKVFLLYLCLITICGLIAEVGAVVQYTSLEIPDRAEQGSLIYGKVSEGTRVFVKGEEVFVTKDGKFIFGVGRDEDERLDIMALGTDGTRIKRVLLIKEREWNIQKIDDLPDNMVNPTLEEEIKIEQDSREVRAARNILLQNFFPENFVWPVMGEISSFFGSRRILNDEEKRPHGGIDIAADEGVYVAASADGVVVYTNDDSFYNGKIVIVNHGMGITSTYAHLSEIDVQVGKLIKKGEKIGEVGSSGRSTGPHLHFGITWFNIYVDPLFVFALNKDSKI